MKNKVNQSTQFQYILGAIISYICAWFILAIPAHWIWNNTVADLFKVNQVGYLDMVRLIILVRILVPTSIKLSSGDTNNEK